MAGVKPYTTDSWKKTNGELLRSLTDEALARTIHRLVYLELMRIRFGLPATSPAEWLRWLREEAVSDG